MKTMNLNWGKHFSAARSIFIERQNKINTEKMFFLKPEKLLKAGSIIKKPRTCPGF
jgi:hypothetical protein